LIILRRDSGVRFDPALPGWHLYGTDVATQARARGLRAWAGALPTIHNDRFHGVLGADFATCYHFLRKKWARRLPLRSPIVKIGRSSIHLWRSSRRTIRSQSVRLSMATDTSTAPEALAARCGWTDLTDCLQ
jgi:hypothetical protein